jgi:hypothetical protein
MSNILKTMFEAIAVKDDEVGWEITNSSQSITLTYPPKYDGFVAKFLRHVFENPGQTKEAAYGALGRSYARGHNSSILAAIHNAGLIEIVNNKYYLGKNYGKWTQGKLVLTNPKTEQDKIRAERWGLKK